MSHRRGSQGPSAASGPRSTRSALEESRVPRGLAAPAGPLSAEGGSSFQGSRKSDELAPSLGQEGFRGPVQSGRWEANSFGCTALLCPMISSEREPCRGWRQGKAAAAVRVWRAAWTQPPW